MKLFAWNVRQGGARRAGAILAVIGRHAPDILVLTELRPRSTGLLAALAAQGWLHQVTGIAVNPVASVGIVSRDPILQLAPAAPAAVLPGRWLEVTVPAQGLTIAGAYGPLPREAYRSFWSAVLNTVRCARADYVLAGDLNTGQSLCDVPNAPFFCSNYFMALQAAGLVDLWRQRNPNAREYSWYSCLPGGAVGSGFRLDHVLASPNLVSRVVSCSYDHATRQTEASDHAPICVEFSAAAPAQGAAS
jgi:exonuclease III